MNRSLLLIALVCGLSCATNFDDCGSTASDVSFYVASCDSPPCIVKLGESFPIWISFTPSEEVDEVTAQTYAIINGIPAPWPGFDHDGCNYMTGEQCPLQAGVNATWNYPVYVDPSYPTITVDAQFMLKNGQEKLACCRIPVTIEN